MTLCFGWELAELFWNIELPLGGNDQDRSAALFTKLFTRVP
jgi:hypothetical protein